jgi:cephalosporin-C deacetylase
VIDFDQFWRDVRDEHQAGARGGAVEWQLVPRGELVESKGLRWRVDWLRFSSVDDLLIYGWVARPADHEPTRAGFLWLPGYSYGTPPPDETNLVPGTVTLCVNVHGNLPDEPYVNPAGKNDYITAGIVRPESFIYRKIVLHCLYAVDILGALEWVDAGETAVGGMSQGGTLALLVAANHGAPCVCFADMPFLCSFRTAMSVSHSPAYKAIANAIADNPAATPDILDTVSLFDPLYHAPKIAIPAALSAGGKDPASPASTIEPVYEALASTIKQYRLYPEAGHVFLPEMVHTYTDWIMRFALDRNPPDHA